jgi:hypothetical protein
MLGEGADEIYPKEAYALSNKIPRDKKGFLIQE